MRRRRGRPRSPRRDIAIYSPFAAVFYDAAPRATSHPVVGGGGAELQTTMLARALAGSGFRVAHIVLPVTTLEPSLPAGLDVIERSARLARGGMLAKLAEPWGVWRGLASADARVYVFRTGLSGGVAGFAVGAIFCALRRRRLILAASNDLDFMFGGRTQPLVELAYRCALRAARRIVVQSGQQLELARSAVNGDDRVTLIPSFAEPAPLSNQGVPGSFLWIGRFVEYKQPLKFVQLARELPDQDFTMVGSRSPATPSALEDGVVAAAGATPNLELFERMPREQVLDLISRARAVVSTSHHEGMPNVFLEAWARGVPVVSLQFDPDGRIAERNMGVAASGSWSRFRDAIAELDQEATRQELGANGRRYIEELHSLDAVGQRWVELMRHELSE